MLTQILLTTILLPLLLGVAISFIGKRGTSFALVLTTLLIPIAAVIISVSIEGFPPFPPIAARQKLPVLLLAGGVSFAALAVVYRNMVNRWVLVIFSVISLAVPAWWLGRNILAANTAKAVTLAITAAIIAITIILISRTQTRKPSAAALPAALLSTVIATALAAVTGGYIGMAQMNGALAALFGGWLLVRYGAYLRGNDTAFELSNVSGLSFIWTSAMGVMMTVLLAPSAAPLALVLAVLPGAIFAFFGRFSACFAGQPRFLRPLIIGVLTGLPAIASIAIAVLAGG